MHSLQMWAPPVPGEHRQDLASVPGAVATTWGGAFDERRIIANWHAKAGEAKARGFAGLRMSGNGFWLETNKWKEFWKYEAALDRFLEGQNIIALCTYPLNAACATDLIDATQTHSYSLARRNARWDFLETAEVAEAYRQIRRLNRAIEILSKPFPGSDLLTPRELLVLAQIVKGASSKEAARDLGISPRISSRQHNAQA
jgi:hypothetical protein